MYRMGALLFCAATTMTACVGQIPIVGYDMDGKIIETAIPKERYVQQMRERITDLSDSILPVVGNARYDEVNLHLRGIRLGLGLKGSVGIGDYFRLGGNLGFNLHFSNKL